MAPRGRETREGITNLEGHEDFDIVWPWAGGKRLPSGNTVVLRVRDEAPSLPFVLPGILKATDRAVLVDNLSSDGSGEIAKEVAARHGFADCLEVVEYPFEVSRCGSEHLNTPERSVHSLAYFYNWAFAHVKTSFSMKWDGDMVLTEEGVASFKNLAWKMDHNPGIVTMPRHPLLVRDSQVAYLDAGMRNVEEWMHPMSASFTFTKAFEWEMRRIPQGTPVVQLPGGMCVEIKWLKEDEFAHWSDPGVFADNARTQRKLREFQVQSALQDGNEDLPGVIKIESPDQNVHVIDYVVETWLPNADRPIVKERLNI